MFHKTNHLPSLVRLVLLLALTAGIAVAARKSTEPTGTPATLTFDDLDGDAIRSDGQGPYDATIDGDILSLATGTGRGLYFDFSNRLAGSGGTPFGSADSGTASNVTMTVNLAQAYATFAFNGAGGQHLLDVTGLEIDAFDDNGDTVPDRYVISTTGDAQHDAFVLVKKGGRGREPGSAWYEWQGSFSMPWGIEVVVN